MANIKPFKAYFYNSAKVGDISTVVAPTRYNISDNEKNELYKSNEYNAIRLFDGKSYDNDDENSNKYIRSYEYMYCKGSFSFSLYIYVKLKLIRTNDARNVHLFCCINCMFSSRAYSIPKCNHHTIILACF